MEIRTAQTFLSNKIRKRIRKRLQLLDPDLNHKVIFYNVIPLKELEEKLIN